MTTIHKLRCAAVTAAMLAAALVPAATADTKSTRTLLLVRTTDGPSSYSLGIGITPRLGSQAFYGSVSYRTESRRVAAAYYPHVVTFGRHSSPNAFVNGTWVHPADDKLFLNGADVVGETWQDDGIDDSPNRLLIVVEGATQLNVMFSGKGWRLTKIAGVVHRRVHSDEALAAGAGSELGSAEVLLGATATGGKGGSIASATLPCSTGGVGVGRGIGQLTLDGGVNSVRATCPVDQVMRASFSAAKATWNLHGVVAGQSDFRDTALWVVDLGPQLLR